jgi:hypothetical protein
MMNIAKGFRIALVFLFCVSAGVFAQAAVLEDLAGTVEIKRAGSSRRALSTSARARL